MNNIRPGLEPDLKDYYRWLRDNEDFTRDEWPYENGCWRCHTRLTHDTNDRCNECHWFVCHKCGCCFLPGYVYDRVNPAYPNWSGKAWRLCPHQGLRVNVWASGLQGICL